MESNVNVGWILGRRAVNGSDSNRISKYSNANSLKIYKIHM
jgi:hypothetical protein